MFKGSMVALVTPFKKKEIDYTAVENLIDFHLANKTDGILLCGTTGENPTLASDEKEQLVRFTVKKVDGRIPIMMGTGTNNAVQTISTTQKAQNLGVDYALVITPYYNKPTQKGLYLFFKEVAENTNIPIIIYNVPGRTGVNIEADTVLKLAYDFEKIVGIKEASGNLDQITKIVRDAPENFSMLSGEDAINLPIMACGGVGTVSVTANVVPDKVHEMVEHCLQGDFDKAKNIHLYLRDLNKMMFIETNPIPAKEALYMMGKLEKEFRLPLCTMSDANRAKLTECLKEYKLI
jgi:4-hydroxy-tetrahydrodipicolinate synthase